MTILPHPRHPDAASGSKRSCTPPVLRLLGLGALAATLSCMRQTTTQVLTPPTARPVVAIAGDTITYVVGIETSRERHRFLAELEDFIRTYATGTALTRDTVDGYVRVQILQPVDVRDGGRDTAIPIMTTEELAPLEGIPAAAGGSASPDTIAAIAGGTVTVFSQRGCNDEPWRPMVSALPFAMPGAGGQADAEKSFFTVETESDRRIKLALVGNPINSSGGALSAFDIVQAWTEAVRKHPAEGLALFRNVKGIEGFLRGEEAVIPGLQSVDSRTIQIALARPDLHAVERLCSYRLLPPELGSGPYRMADASTTTTLTPNPRFGGSRPALDKCIFKSGNDANPLVGFSLGKYEVVALSAAKDIAYAREKLQASAHIRQYSEDYYFLALAHESLDVRRMMRSLCNSRDLLTSVIRAEGSVLAALETPPVVLPEMPTVTPEAVQIPLGTKPLSIIYQKTDPISARIAQKLVADAARAGVSCSLRALDEGAYERALLARDYAGAIGWVASTITQSASERLRLATMWFADESNEDARIDSVREIPLFSVRRFALCKRGVDFCRGTPASLCRTAAQ